MSLDFATIEQQPQLAALLALETTAQAARLALIVQHRDFFEIGAQGDPVEPTATRPTASQIAGQLVDQTERLMDTIQRYRTRVLGSDSAQSF